MEVIAQKIIMSMQTYKVYYVVKCIAILVGKVFIGHYSTRTKPNKKELQHQVPYPALLL